MIEESAVEEAVHWLADNAKKAAQRRAERVYEDEYRKSLKAILMKEHAGESGIVQEREAYADPRYIDHLKKIKETVYRDELNRAMRSQKEILIEAWRSQNANYRALKI